MYSVFFFVFFVFSFIVEEKMFVECILEETNNSNQIKISFIAKISFDFFGLPYILFFL